MEANKKKKHLPSLISIEVKNFSLYPGNLNLTYKFIDGINLIIGGNGVGKTTFLNILKFALVGLYKKDIDVKRREYSGVEYRYEKRVNLPYKFFSNRMDNSVNYNSNAKVILKFSIDETVIEVTRNLHIPSLEKVVYYTDIENQKELDGKVITQSEFDVLFSDKKKNLQILHGSLQWKYEELVGKLSNHEYFDNLIFLVNDILFFSEARKTIMWDGTVQDKLLSKYFIDPVLDNKKEEYEREAKYQNSLARHKSEDIRAINKIFEKIESSSNGNNNTYLELLRKAENLKQQVENYFKELETKHKDREKSEVLINKLHSEKNQLSKKIDDLEKVKRIEEESIFSSLFKKVTPKYYDYLNSLKVSGDCPLCNNELPSVLFNKIKSNEAHCMMCDNEINSTQLTSEKLDSIKILIKEVLQGLRNKEKDIIKEEDELRKFDNDFRDFSLQLNKCQSDLRQVEFALQKYQKNDATNANNSNSEFKAMKGRIDELEKEKEIALDKSKIANSNAKKIIKEIDVQRLESREQLSGIFNSFGSKFLGVNCELVYEDPKDDEGKRYFPRINGIDRLDEEELSESQRFFIDQSFRMSILDYFNSSSSFFMCETPDSSLDISYERNAAKIFLEYIKKPNQLIITSNLNNSEFLEYLIDQTNNIDYINLLKVGKQSDIQSRSEQLIAASDKIENKINGKK
ncbi:AAA family ATPase [Flavobacterium sp. fv08]|uniref:AAA family ATPase n=1 Tax=Flavobacterium sp. fv08 TaxID=1761784 RepID=UPI0008B9CC90|nr:AAA family ATPase [Flavobacterium sp. fv08]SEP06487.1 AAA domain-containing protein [Flavobacterium sp. fv08]